MRTLVCLPVTLLFLLGPLAPAFAKPVAKASRFCPRLATPQHQRQTVMIQSGDIRSLRRQLDKAAPGTTFLFADGTYSLTKRQVLKVATPQITIRSASGNRDGVIIEGGRNNIAVNADDFTVADLTLRTPRHHNIQVRGEKGAQRPTIYNVHLVDAGQQFVKVSAGKGTPRKFSDQGLVACSLIEYTTYSRGSSSSPASYTNGIDMLAGKGWVIRDNTLRRIRSKEGKAGPAILIWKNAQDTVITRNLIIDSWRGIALGLGKPNKYSRGGPQVQFDHQNGRVENNIILALNEPADSAIENNWANNSHIIGNVIYYNEKLKHKVNWSIEYRFPPTTVVIQNNLSNLPILKRRPFPHNEAQQAGNVTNAPPQRFQPFLQHSRADLFDTTFFQPEQSKSLARSARSAKRAQSAQPTDSEWW